MWQVVDISWGKLPIVGKDTVLILYSYVHSIHAHSRFTMSPTLLKSWPGDGLKSNP